VPERQHRVGLNAVMFHLGRGPAPQGRTQPGTRQRDWSIFADRQPELVATRRRYLDQLTLSLRPGIVETIDTNLRLFAEFLTTNHPEVAPGSAACGDTRTWK
jgi:hypothetical protein